MKKILISIFAATLIVPSAMAYLTPEDARRMAEDGDTAGAIETLKEFLGYEPKNAEGRLLLGELAWATGQDSLAEAVLDEARRQGSRDALLKLAEMAIDTYRFDRAEELLDSYVRTNAGKRRRKAAPVDEDAARLRERLQRLQGLMERVERIAVIDSVNVDAGRFLSAYRLSPESGKVAPVSDMPPGLGKIEGATFFLPQSGRQVIWSGKNADGGYSLRQADALTGGEWESPVDIDPMAGEDGDVNYPFLLPDGESSIGGYDIYMARRNADNGFLEPVNLGMPYNSPFNDYMMAIDEYTGVGWFASDRNRIPGKVTVYVFVPSEMRVNVDADDPALRARALLSPIAATQEEGVDYSHLLEAVRRAGAESSAAAREISLYIPGRGLVTSLSQLKTDAGRHAAKVYAQACGEYAAEVARLDAMRVEYGRGNESLAPSIRSAEESLDTRRHHLTSLLNKVIQAEKK